MIVLSLSDEIASVVYFQKEPHILSFLALKICAIAARGNYSALSSYDKKTGQSNVSKMIDSSALDCHSPTPQQQKHEKIYILISFLLFNDFSRFLPIYSDHGVYPLICPNSMELSPREAAIRSAAQQFSNVLWNLKAH
jgi:hypothetical protein